MRNEQRVATEAGLSPFRLPLSAFYLRSGFTLVELLVVITIIGILAALLLAAVQRARVAAARAVITSGITELDTAIKDLKNSVGSFPPNAQTDDTNPVATPEQPAAPLVENTILTDFKQFMAKAFPQHREHEALIKALVGQSTTAQDTNIATNLPGGMTAAEALVFWIGGFSDDPKYPISGAGGPSYLLRPGQGEDNEQDPIDTRSWRLGVNIQDLGPRGEDDYFPANYNRFIVYNDPRDSSARRRINMWVLTPGNSPAPYVYFDASRGTGVTAGNDVPAATSLVDFAGSREFEETLNQTKYVYPIKQVNPSTGAALRYQFANNGSFQILHAGVDREWVLPDPTNPSVWIPMPQVVTMTPANELVFPTGPWTAELADMQTNLASGTLESAQP